MNRDEKVKKMLDEFKQKIEKLCKEYGISRARATTTILKPKIDEEQRSMAIDAIEDAIENRKIARYPHDKGLDLAKTFIQNIGKRRNEQKTIR